MYKKILSLLLAAGMTLSLAACGDRDVGVIGGSDGPTQIIVSDSGTEATPAPEASPAPEDQETAAPNIRDERYVFISNGVYLTPDADMGALSLSLGEPLSYFEAASCAFEGLDKVYTYAGFEVDTYPTEAGDCISAIILKDDTVATPEGVMIGESAQRVLEVYGEPSSSTDTLYTYEKGGSALRFILRGEEIASIEYVSLTALNAQ